MPVSAEIIILPKEREVNSGFVSPVRISAHAGIVVFAEKWYYYNGKAVLCLSLIHISEPTRRISLSRMPSSA